MSTKGSLEYVTTLYIPFYRVLAGQDSQQQSGTVLIKNGTEVFPVCHETKRKKKKSAFFYNRMFIPFILPPCERVFPLGILECIKQQ